jgi:hypothetical protein
VGLKFLGVFIINTRKDKSIKINLVSCCFHKKSFVTLKSNIQKSQKVLMKLLIYASQGVISVAIVQMQTFLHF